MNQIVIAQATENDKEKIVDFLSNYSTSANNISYHDNGTYYIAKDGSKIVAVSGLTPSDFKDVYALEFSATSPKYRNNGIMSRLFGNMLNNFNGTICAECTKQPTMHALLTRHGFVELKKENTSGSLYVKNLALA